jgi:hypothetical protein
MRSLSLVWPIAALPGAKYPRMKVMKVTPEHHKDDAGDAANEEPWANTDPGERRDAY